VGQGEPLVDGADVCHAVARIDHHAGQEALGVERQYGLEFEVETSSMIRVTR
jgi:hypothetical protein